MEKCDSKYCNCLYHSANVLAREITRMAEEEFTKTGLSPSYAYVLMSIHDQPGIQPKELSEELQLTPSTITRLIDKMQHQGYVTRESKGRTTKIHPTDKCIEIIDEVKKSWYNLYLRYTKVLGEKFSRDMVDKINTAREKLIT